MARFPSVFLLACLTAPLPALAQGVVQAVPGTTDSDRLAAQMRLLAVNANDLSALLAAGELSVKLDDLGAAASFFARADKVDLRNGRAKAGEGAILVHAERPGEALRYFAQAESYGLPPAAFASDRGLAYDLLGEQERAQRDYRLALRASPAAAPDEETQRRYALSLAIAGKRELADQQLQPLLRQSNRGAWRVHAFVLAMGGNVAEANRIATTMMPPGTAAGLQPFLEKLPTLAPIDRAYAVHFGEVRSTPQRVADAKLAPALPALGPDPYAPRLAVAAVAAPVAKDKRRGKDKDKGKRQPVQVAVATPAPEPLPQAPRYRAQPGTAVLATRGAAPAAWPTTIASGAAVAGSGRGVSSIAGPAAIASLPVAPTRQAAIAVPVTRPVAPPVPVAVPAPDVRVIVAVPAPRTQVRIAAPAVSQTVAAATLPPVQTPSPPVSPPTPVALAALPATSPPALPAATTTPASAPVEPIVTNIPVPPPHRSDGALARIVAGLPIPAAELGVAGPTRPAVAAPAADEHTVDAAAEQAAADRAAHAASAKAVADKRAADRKAAADKKALAEKKAAAEQKAQEEREAAAQKKLERANPERIWVQVAGGAYAGDLPKAWAAAKAKGGAVFAGHATGWTTPLRATNRVLAGPFKTGEEARAFVNTLKAGGMSTFTFTSEAGQVVTKLPAK
ncbi:tetratricopeptide repeat protein [Sphingomonas bacterium]|uniref:tetratricopeptide repeat protein n=1 Tax=Sphingomonas bacterium TaxID=1895847 RepID=UPI001575C82B|nr:tetratricopeptide repeat protein [Sphingomonas bacterium]